MTEKELKKVLFETSQIIGDLFGVEPDSITLETTRESISGWDSLQHVNVILDVEKYFAIRFDESQVTAIQTVGDLVKAIQSAAQNPDN